MNNKRQRARWQIPMGISPKGRKAYILEGEIKDKFIELYPKTSDRDMAGLFGCSSATIRHLRLELGLADRDRKTIKNIASTRRKATLRLRGYVSHPSEAFLTRVRNMSTENCPINRIRRTDPERYKTIRQKMTESFRALVKAEKRRILYGLPRKTKLNVKLTQMSSKATSQKHYMIKDRNYFADPEHASWVCYDSQTRRSAQREATAIKNGLKVVKADEEETTGNR